MKKRKPRGPVPSLIGGSNGRPERVLVAKKSECSRCKVIFQKGETCIKIPRLGAGYSTARRVCDECFIAILQQTDKDLDQLRTL